MATNDHFSTTAIFFFSWRTVYALNIVSTSLQRSPLYNGLSFLLSTTVESLQTVTSLQRPFVLADSPYTESCFNLCTMATFFFPQGREVQLYLETIPSCWKVMTVLAFFFFYY